MKLSELLSPPRVLPSKPIWTTSLTTSYQCTATFRSLPRTSRLLRNLWLNLSRSLIVNLQRLMNKTLGKMKSFSRFSKVTVMRWTMIWWRAGLISPRMPRIFSKEKLFCSLSCKGWTSLEGLEKSSGTLISSSSNWITKWSKLPKRMIKLLFNLKALSMMITLRFRTLRHLLMRNGIPMSPPSMMDLRLRSATSSKKQRTYLKKQLRS